MRATFTGKANQIKRPGWHNTIEDMVEVELDLQGSVIDVDPANKPANLKGTLRIKQPMADKLPFGTSFTITLDTNEPAKQETKETI